MQFVTINSGESIGIRVLKISSIPHLSILNDDLSAEQQEKSVGILARNMASLLNEVYDLYKEWHTRQTNSADISIEVTWTTEAVANQPFKACINLYVVLRAINSDNSKVAQSLNELGKLFVSSLLNDKYDVKDDLPVDKYAEAMTLLGRSDLYAIVREERIEDLQNQYLPAALTFDLFPRDYPDLSKLASILTDHPEAMVIFQLIPTHFSSEELSELSRLDQIVSMLSQGVQERNIGTMSISAADRVSDFYKYYFSHKTQSLFTFNILVCGAPSAVGAIATRTMGQISTTSGNAPALSKVKIDPQLLNSGPSALYSMPWVINDAIINISRDGRIWQSGLVSPALYRLPYIVTAEEASAFFRLPAGSDKVNAGLKVNETSRASKTYSSGLINTGAISIGRLKSSPTHDFIGFDLKDLAKHALIVGTPGSGKTTFSVGLLDRLWKDHKIPFLVIEPAKNEYRALVQSIPELQIFTPGKNFISPFVFNPFVPPKNVRLETYKSTLKTAFAAGVSMSSPLDKIFEETVANCYSDHRWLDSYTAADKGKVFNMEDFIKCFKETFEEIGYTGDARNIGRAGLVRLKSLEKLFDNYFSIPIEDLLSRPTVIELAAIENPDEKALIIALLLLSILAYVNANYVGEGGFRNFLLLEEAHVLLASDSEGTEGGASPSTIAQGLVKRMLAEIRSYGVGIAIADQSPRKVGLDIVALTDIKVAFRLVESQDKQILADSTGMSETQIKRLAKLKPGEAFLFFNRLEEAEEIVTPNYRLENSISISLSDDSIRQLSTYWRTRGEKLRPYPQCTLTPYCRANCDYSRRLLAKEVARRLFKKHIGNGCNDSARLVKTFQSLGKLIQEELNDEPFTPELRSCVKVHLWRHVIYESKLPLKDQTIISSLQKN